VVIILLKVCIEFVSKIANNSHMQVQGRWNLIWKLKVPPKIKKFLWRMCRGCFPTRARLNSRGVSCPTDCVHCNKNYEDSIHVLIECPKVVQVWRDANLSDKTITFMLLYSLVCNIDASFSNSLNRVGLVCVLGMMMVLFVLARTEWFSPLCDVEVGEAAGLHTTLDWISNQQFDNVDFVLDCKKVVDCNHSSLDDSSEFGCIINACKHLLENRFQNSHVEFNRRQANRVAHELAQATLSNPSHHITYVYLHVFGKF